MAEKMQKMIRIKWVRSGIGFTHHQKTIVRSLGLTKLSRTVLRPDTPQIRGIVASVPHLLEIIPEPVVPAWARIPEYTVHPPVAEPVAPVEPAPVVATEAAGGGAALSPESHEVKSAGASPEQESSPEGSATGQVSKE